VKLLILKIPEPSIQKEVNNLVEVKKKDNESFENLLRRFNRKVQQSGVLIRARKTRFFTPGKSRNLQRQAAQRRTVIRAEKEEQKKLGKPIKKFNKFHR
jgi:ribosomal protein S21